MFPLKRSLVTYSSVTDRNMKLSQLILDKNASEKIDSKITLPYISSIIEGMSKGKANPSITVDQVKATIVDDPNILKLSFVKRVKKIETTVGHFVFEYLNSMKPFLNEKDFYINPVRVRNLIHTYNVNKCELPENLHPECYVSIQF